MNSANKSVVWLITYNFGAVKAGPVIRFMRYVPHFREKGYELFFITRLREGESERMEDENGVKSVHISCSSPVELCEKSLNLALTAENPPSALVFFSISYKNYWHLRRAVRKGLKCIYVSTMQLDLLNHAGKNRSWLRRRVLTLVLRKLYGLMNTIVSSTAELQKDFSRLGVPEKKLKVIYNGVDVDRFSPVTVFQKREYRKQLDLPLDSKIFIYVGLFVDRKGVSDLVNTFALCQERTQENVKLLMVGNEMSMDENSEEFKNKWPDIKQNALNKGWLITHPFSRSIDIYYKAADAFVFMSKLEGMPNVILESMACGLPVFTTHFKGFGDAYGEENSNYIKLNREIETDTKVILAAINNPLETAKIGSSGRVWALSEFSLSKSISEYCQILDN